MIRVAILSFWHVHGKDYARAAEEHPDTEIVAIWDEDPTRGRAEAEQRGVPFYNNLDELLAQPEIDAVVVTTPTNMHHQVIIAAARAGKHIFTEKVIAATLREAEEILAAVEAAGVTMMVSLWRSDEAYAHEVKATIDQGLLGELTQVRVRDGHPLALPSDDFPRGRLPEHFFDPEQAQGGALIDLCHPAYLTLLFLGRPESISATLTSVTGRAVDDNAVVTLRYANGAIGIAETGFVTRASPFMIEAHGTEGSLLFDISGIGEMVARRMNPSVAGEPGKQPDGPDGKLHIWSTRHPETPLRWVARDLPPSAPKAFSQWVTHMQQGTKATANLALGLDLSAFMEAAYRSAATGQAVRLDSLEHAD
jgi:1,5-anhydro-D-fructose reductase (1,5-anhydro-D-mannitol-forming)